MNDRPQSGSALYEGGIQFMQNRRIPADDHRGMGEWLDEKDSYGNGIRVPATYYIDIFDSHRGQGPRQRLVQHRTDDPAQYFFNFDLISGGKPGVPSDLSHALSQAGINGTVKMVSLPLAKNKILVRLENLADHNDYWNMHANNRKVEFKWLLEQMWKDANQQADSSPSVTIKYEEMSLTGNMKLTEMWDRKIQWKTRDDPKDGELPKTMLDYGVGDVITLEGQRIRVFEVTYTPATQALFLN